ncbi:TRAP transporter substrate-binding protein [Hydrogenophaga sp.]|uniref:TRAP transporter substrate-binding protein n=1 Tax=Hydrogenophaga sp. TaxID=1904254 RepID=UPI002FC7D641
MNNIITRRTIRIANWIKSHFLGTHAFSSIHQMINRRTIVQLAVGMALGAPSLTGFAQQSITLRFHTFMSPMSNVWVSMNKVWMEKVQRESDGRIRFEAYPAMQLDGAPVQPYDQARDGVADIVWTLTGYSPGGFPCSEVFVLPFMTTNAEATSKAFWEFIKTKASNEYKEVHPIAVQVHRPGMLHTRDRLFEAPYDLRGLKMRGPTRQTTKMLGYLGANAVGMPLPKIPDALQKGPLDGCVIPWDVVPSVKVHELTKFHSQFDPASGALYTTKFVTATNKRKYESLPPDVRKVLDPNSGITASASLGRAHQCGDDPARKLVEARGNVTHNFGQVEAQEFRRAASQVEVEWVKDMESRGFDGRDLLSTARALIEKHTKTTKT